MTQEMTFTEFQATRREATAAEIEATGYNMSQQGRGYLYHGNGVIESTEGWTIPAKAYYLLLENCEYENDNIVELEKELFKYAVSSDWIRATCAYCRRILTSGGDVVVSEKGNVFCSACVDEGVEEEERVPRTVYDFFEQHLGEPPADESLRDVKTEISPCGRDCANVIATAAAFVTACDSSMRKSIIRLAEEAIGIYWRG